MHREMVGRYMESNKLGYALLDTGSAFTLFNQSSKINVAYGTFALLLVNNDYQKLIHSITDTIHQFLDNTFTHDHIDKFILSLYYKIDYHISFSSKGYLHKEQAHMITQLLLSEILQKLEAINFELTNIEDCIPYVFSIPQIQVITKDILKRTSTDLSLLMNNFENYEIDSQLLYMNLTIFYPKTTLDYLLLDLKMYLERSQHTVKECERCKRLFIPTRKSDKYCRLPLRYTTKNCANLMHISPNDEFAKARNKARDKQHKQIRYYINKQTYDRQFLMNLYYDWSTDCGIKCIQYKQVNDITGFIEWITKTKFTSNIIKNEWNKYKENKGQTL